jgi:hypothetical protein
VQSGQQKIGGDKLDYSKLEQNICDVIKEDQIKLGYQKEVIRLYYPLGSLNHFLKSELRVEEMRKALEDFAGTVKEKLGTIEISNEGERFCFCFPPEASEYIHSHTPQTGFLYDFIDVVSRHGVTMDEVIAVFKKYSNNVHVEKTNHGEFDYLIYFKDGQPDSFRYCLTEEGCHIIFHRFTIEDYADFQFEG